MFIEFKNCTKRRRYIGRGRELKEKYIERGKETLIETERKSERDSDKDRQRMKKREIDRGSKKERNKQILIDREK